MPESRLPFLFILSLIACCIEVDISVPSFPEISHYFKVSENIVQLTIAYNFLGFCLSAFVFGPLSECYGRRKIMIIGNAILLIGATLCVFAPSIEFLLVARFVQGIGASTSAVIVFTMIADIYKGEKAIRLIGIMNSVLTILIAIAPIIGGFVNKTVGWRGNYTCVALISFISWILLLFLLPETKIKLETFNLKDILKNYRKVLLNLEFFSSSMVPSLMYSAYMSFVACASFLYMETFGLSVICYAAHQTVIVSFFAVASTLSGKLIQFLGNRGCIFLGIGLSLIGSILLMMLSIISPYSPLLTTISMSIFSLGFAISYPVIFSSSLEIFPEIKGIASSSIMAMRALLVGSIVSLSGYFYNGHPIRVATVIIIIIVLVPLLTSKLQKTLFLLNHRQNLTTSNINSKKQPQVTLI